MPLSELATMLTRVLLVDAVHPLAARIRAARDRNVAMITADLSGSFPLLLSRRLDLEVRARRRDRRLLHRVSGFSDWRPWPALALRRPSEHRVSPCRGAP